MSDATTSAAGSFHRFRLDAAALALTGKNTTASASQANNVADSELGVSASTKSGTSVAASAKRRRAQSDAAPAILACIRCRRVKKKCDRTLPGCLLCQRAGVACHYPMSLVPSGSSTLSELRGRIEWLSNFIDSLRPIDAAPVASLATGHDLAIRPNQPETSTHTGSVFSAGSVMGDSTTYTLDRVASPDHVLTNDILSQHTINDDALDDGLESPDQINSVSSNEQVEVEPGDLDSCMTSSPHVHLSNHTLLAPVRHLPDSVSPIDLGVAYFNHVHQSYPFLDRAQTLAEVEALGSLFINTSAPCTLVNARVYLVMAIGCEILCRLQSIPSEVFSSFIVPTHEVVRLAMDDASIDTVQLLLLLTLYSVFDPQGWSPWMLTGILGRRAGQLGLNHRATSKSHRSLEDQEYRHRLFWCIFSVDRLVSVSFGLPFSVGETDIDVPLPGVTTTEYGAADQARYITTLQVARQAIALRQLAGRIMALVHTESDSMYPDLVQYMEGSQRRKTLHALHRSVHDWYTQGCLLARQEPHDVPIHNTIPWLNINMNEVLLLLYGPSPFNPSPGTCELSELYHAVQKYIQSAYALFTSHHLALNHTTLNRLLVTWRLLMHCHMWCEATADDIRRDHGLLIQSQQILEGFRPSWTDAPSVASLFRRFALIVQDLTDTMSAIDVSDTVPGGSFDGRSDYIQVKVRGRQRADLDSSIDDCDKLMRHVLGEASAYNYFARGSRQYSKTVLFTRVQSC